MVIDGRLGERPPAVSHPLDENSEQMGDGASQPPTGGGQFSATGPTQIRMNWK